MMIYIPLVLVVVVGLVIGGKRFNERSRADTLRKEALIWCGQSLSFLMLLQKRRGMMGSLLSGDRQFSQPISELNRELARLADSLQKTELETQLPYARVRGDQLIAHVLSARFNAPADSFQAHSDGIRVILDQLWFVAERYQLSTHIDSGRRRGSEQALQVLPLLVEQLGQMRGLSTLTASQGRCSAAMRLRLIYLMDQVTQTLAKADCAKQPAEQFIGLVEEQVLKSDQVKADAGVLFAQATEAIEIYLDNTRTLLRQLA